MIHSKVQLAYTPETLPATILERFEPGWTAIQACRAVGVIDDVTGDEVFVLYEDGPGPRSGILVKEGDVKPYDPLSAETVAADPTGRGEGGHPPLEDEVAEIGRDLDASDRIQRSAERQAGVTQDGKGIYRLNYTEDTLPAAVHERFGEDWTVEDILTAQGTIEDEEEEENGVKTYYVEFVRKSDGLRAMLACRRDDLVRITQACAVPEQQPGSSASFITKVYLSETTAPIFVLGEARMVGEAFENAAPNEFVWFQVVAKDARVTWDEVGIPRSQVKSVRSDNDEHIH